MPGAGAPARKQLPAPQTALTTSSQAQRQAPHRAIAPAV